MQYNISLLVGLKNNLDYNKHFYTTTRKLYPEVEICFVSYGSTDGTHEWLHTLNDPNVNYYCSTEQKTFSDTFNKAAELATKEYVAYLHNDIVLASNFLENLQKHVAPNHIISYTTIEPPIFAGHERPGKIIKDLGANLDTFNLEALYSFAKEKQIEYKDKTESGITFFMCMPRKTLLEVGGMDNLFNPMFCEDDDVINRFKLLGLETFTSLDAICYHFVSKTSRFSEEYQNKTQQIEINSNRNYIRKWGSRTSTKKYDTGFVVEHCNYDMLSALEPWCSTIYLNDEMQVLTSHYLDAEQKNTKYNLNKKIKDLKHTIPNNDVVVRFDGRQLTNESFQLLIQLPDIIAESGEVGDFELDIFKVSIYSMERYEQKLITNDNLYYTNQLL